MFKFITDRPLWINILAGLVIVGILFFIFVNSLNAITHHNEGRPVPTLIGKSVKEAEEIVDKEGFEVQIADSIYTDTAKALQVIRQVPEPEALVKSNRTIYLTINRAVPPLIEMPDLVGYSFRSAEMALKNSFLVLGDTSFKPDFAKNAVLAQQYNGAVITPGTKIRMGSKISLVLGDGVGDMQFVVPDLTGLTYRDAKTLLERNGLAFGAVLASDVDDTATAYIYRQQPERKDAFNKVRYIRSGQMIDIWLQRERPAVDSTANALPETEEEEEK